MIEFVTFTSICYLLIGILVGGVVAHKAREKKDPLDVSEVFLTIIVWPVVLAYIWMVSGGKKDGR